MKLTQTILLLVSALSATLNINKSEAATNTDLQAKLDKAKADVASVHDQLEQIGDPLTDEQKAQIQQLLDATSAATPHPDVPAPVVDVPAPAAAPADPTNTAPDAAAN